MPPRYAYWTILIDQKPTAFRAREREELLPTLQQLRRTNADVVMKWFARGRLWESPEAAQAAQRAPKPPLEKRGRDWRPGGDHRDPRDRFKKSSQPQSPKPDSWRDRAKPSGRPLSRPWSAKPPNGPPRSARPWAGKPSSGPPRGPRPWSAKPPSGPRSGRPWNDKPKSGSPRTARPWSEAPEKETRKRQPETPSSPAASKPDVSKPKRPDES